MVFNAISEVFPPSLTFFYRNEDPIFSYLKLSKMNFAKCKKKNEFYIIKKKVEI